MEKKITVKFLLLLLVFNGFSVCSASSVGLVEDAVKSVRYLKKNTIYVFDTKKIDIKRSEDAIHSISALLKQPNLSLVGEVQLKYIRALALQTINLKRLKDEDLIILEEAQLALDDFLFVVDKDSILKDNAKYHAGHVAAHLLKDSKLAYKLWESCAYEQHAGCMNVLAHGHFSGINSIRRDIDASIKWHQQVYNTGIKFNCAGIFSASQLMTISYLFPNFDTGDTWLNWRQKRNRLIEKIIEKTQGEQTCYSDGNYFSDYIMFRRVGINNKESFELSLELDKNKERKAAVEAIYKKDIATAIELIELNENTPILCSLSFSAYIYTKHEKMSEEHNNIANYITSLDPEVCETTNTYIDLFHSEGTWLN